MGKDAVEYRCMVYFGLVDALACAVKKEKYRRDDLTSSFVCDILSLSASHKVLITVFPLLSEFLDIDKRTLWEREYSRCLRQYILQDSLSRKVFSDLADRDVDFLPIKGFAVRKFYPENVIRQSGDVDFVYREKDADAVDSVMKSNGFTKSDTDENHSVYILGDVKAEAHDIITSFSDIAKEYYSDVWSMVREQDDGHCYRFSVSDEYIYMVVHTAKHFLDGSAGLRSLTDSYVLRGQREFDREYADRRLSALRLLKFANNLDALADEYFSPTDNKKNDKREGSTILETFFISSGYVTNQSLSASYRAYLSRKSGSRLKYYFRSFFLPYSAMKKKYPTLRKLPFLLPFFWVKRLFDAGRKGHVKEADIPSGFDKKTARKWCKYVSECGLGEYINKSL